MAKVCESIGGCELRGMMSVVLSVECALRSSRIELSLHKTLMCLIVNDYMVHETHGCRMVVRIKGEVDAVAGC